jgi:hypothetical protein
MSKSDFHFNSKNYTQIQILISRKADVTEYSSVTCEVQ